MNDIAQPKEGTNPVEEALLEEALPLPKKSEHIAKVEQAIAEAITGEVKDAEGDPHRYVANVRKLLSAVERVSGVSSFDRGELAEHIPLAAPIERPPMERIMDMIGEALPALLAQQAQNRTTTIVVPKIEGDGEEAEQAPVPALGDGTEEAKAQEEVQP